MASNRYTRYTPYPTPAQVSASVDLQRRATAFLRRELRVWINLDVEFLTNYIVTLIKMLDLRSEAGIKLLSELMDPSIPYTAEGRKPNTEHLAHGAQVYSCSDFMRGFYPYLLMYITELYSFLRSPYKSIEEYDAIVQVIIQSNVLKDIKLTNF